MALSALLLAVSLAATAWAIAGGPGVLSFALFLVVVLPGLPLGFALFGRRHAAGWLAGTALGYAATTLAWWIVVAAGVPSSPIFAMAWAIALMLALATAHALGGPLIALPPWTRTSTTALLLLLLVVPVLVGRPFARLGSTDVSGNRLYRAYFIADFVWHVALTAELARNESPPRNPFLANEPVHYYWTYFRVPATLASETGIDVQTVLKLNALATALALVAAMYVAAWAAFPVAPWTVAFAVALTILAASLEGWAGIADIVRRGLPLSDLRNLNIDALAAWAFKGLRVDNLPRTMWYTPQHGMSCALGLVAVPIALHSNSRSSIAGILLGGCALGASVAFNPLLGAAFCAVYGATVVARALSAGGGLSAVVRHGLAAAPVVAALAWCAWNQVGDGATGALHVGLYGLARNAPLLVFLLQFGPLLILMAPGLWTDHAVPWAPLWPAVIGVAIAVMVMHLLALTVDLAWVGFRGGNIFFVLAPAIVARGLLVLWKKAPRVAVATAAVVVAAGLPTTVIDAFNTQDVENRNLSREAERVRGTDVAFDPANEFHWTVAITPEQQAALDWIRMETPGTAVVQADAIARGRETWSLIPTFAHRRMATGTPVPLLALPIYDERNEQVRQIYATGDARAAWEMARRLGIDYLYVDQVERSAYAAASKFDAAADLFNPVFRNKEAVVYALRP